MEGIITIVSETFEFKNPLFINSLKHSLILRKDSISQILKYKNTDLVDETRAIIRAYPMDQNGE